MVMKTRYHFTPVEKKTFTREKTEKLQNSPERQLQDQSKPCGQITSKIPLERGVKIEAELIDRVCL